MVRQDQEREANHVHKPPLKAFRLVDGHDLHSIHGTRRLSELTQLPPTETQKCLNGVEATREF